MTLKVDTFEHDIADEIRRKEASLAEIQAVSKQNSPHVDEVPQKKLPLVTIVLTITIVISLIGIGGVAYYYFNDSLLPPSSKPLEISNNDIPKVTADLTKLSPTLGVEIGRFISQVEKKDNGYILRIENYSEVFAYMTRNESAYIDELSDIFKDTALQKITSTASTTDATSTEPTGTTTQNNVMKINVVSSSSEATFDSMSGDSISYFKDSTIDNQNMRIYKKNDATVVYAFVGDKAVLIAKTPEGILALRNAILR